MRLDAPDQLPRLPREVHVRRAFRSANDLYLPGVRWPVHQLSMRRADILAALERGDLEAVDDDQRARP